MLTPDTRVVVTSRTGFFSGSGELIHVGRIGSEVVDVLVRMDAGDYLHFSLDKYEVSPET